eukprot:gene9061-18770_t
MQNFCFKVKIVLSNNRKSKAKRRKKVQWQMEEINKITFGGLTSHNIKQDCKFLNKSICCNAVDDTRSDRGIGMTGPPRAELNENIGCKTAMTYVASVYENTLLSSITTMTGNLIDYYKNPVQMAQSKQWLQYVKHQMTTATTSTIYKKIPDTISNDDHLQQKQEQFLSRFRYNKTCPGKDTVYWDEWIEPLSMHARHPFARVTPIIPFESTLSEPLVDMMDVDYILLQSGEDLGRRELPKARHILLDAGSSTFVSSLWYFTWVGLDRVYAWEATPIPPSVYWYSTPPKWLPFVHFYNIPIHPNVKRFESPLHLLQNIAHKEDFVSFKLDVIAKLDTRIFLHLLKNPQLTELLDEFFFEFHFESEIMADSGWGHTGIGNVSYALRCFRTLRERGVRAHFWP